MHQAPYLKDATLYCSNPTGVSNSYHELTQTHDII